MRAAAAGARCIRGHGIHLQKSRRTASERHAGRLHATLLQERREVWYADRLERAPPPLFLLASQPRLALLPQLLQAHLDAF